MKKLIIILLLGACAMVQAQSTYYVATDGSDLYDGGFNTEFATLNFALTQIVGGDTIYVRGGNYDQYMGGFNINTDLNGTPSAYTVIAGYPGERPVFDFDNYTAGQFDQTFFLDMGVQFIHLENFTCMNLHQNDALGNGEMGGINELYAGNIKHINLRMENIEGRGYMHWSYLQNYGVTYDTTFYINCDAINCRGQYPSSGSNPDDIGNFDDGFKCYSEAAAGVYGYVMIYRGCRAINCADDGFDIGSQTGLLIIDQCWSVENGLNSNGYDGNGYKINGSLYVSTGINKVITRSIAANNNFTGFRMQESEGYERSDARLYNNLSFYNIGNGGGIGGGFGNDDNVDDVVIQNEWRNNIAYYNYSDPELTLQREFHFNVYQSSPPTGSNNSFNIVSGYPGWEWNIQADSSDFVSLDIDELKASRQADGSLPSVNFGVLVEGSDFVDAGTTSVTDINSLPYVIPISYNGSAPDIGYAEYGTAQVDSTANDILSFTLAAQTGSATISTVNHTVAIEVEYGTDVTDLSPTITVSPNATIAPLSGASQDFTNPVNYTVTSLDETEQVWPVTVTVAAAPEQPVDYSGYRFTGQKDRLGRAVYTRVDTSTTPSDVLVTGIDVTGTGGATTITTDDGTLQMLADVSPDNATDTTITWSRSNKTGTGTINATGLLTAVSDGTVDVIATANDASGVADTLEITLSNQVSESNPYAVIANHTVVDLYDDIPSNWIDSVKNMMVNVGGMSHGYGYFNGAYILEQMDSTYAVEFWIMDETPPTTSSGELRLGRPYMFGTTSWTSQTGIDGLNSINEGFANSGAVFDVWQIVFSYDFTWNNDPGGDVDPVYDVRWAGDSEGGIDGSRIFGLDNGDTALTSNRVTLLNYFDAVNQWNDYAQAQGFNTLSIFSTGAVDGLSGGTENGFQRELKNQFIRDYIDTVQHQVYFFDYADILTHNAAGELYQATWDDDGTPRPHDQIHPDNQEDYAEYADFGEEDHVGEVGAVRVAKAYWWLLARIAGWDGEP